jgi:hypothetical protein
MFGLFDLSPISCLRHLGMHEITLSLDGIFFLFMHGLLSSAVASNVRLPCWRGRHAFGPMLFCRTTKFPSNIKSEIPTRGNQGRLT